MTIPVLLLLFPAVAAAGEAGTLEVEVRARAVTPGEPVLVVVRCAERLERVEADLFGASLRFQRDREEEPRRSPERWWAWAAVPLDRKPGTVRAKVRATGERGSELRGSLDLRIAPKKFPEQRLKVAERYVTPSREAERRIARERERLDAIYAKVLPAPLPEGPFEKPVPGAASAAFGTRRFFNGKPRAPHAGVDLAAESGTPVRAAGPGRVALADDLYFSGKTVILDHGGGLVTLYGHLSSFEVSEGDEVSRGGIVGRVGATGRATGPHLHWGARVGGRIVDPAALLDPSLFR